MKYNIFPKSNQSLIHKNYITSIINTVALPLVMLLSSGETIAQNTSEPNIYSKPITTETNKNTSNEKKEETTLSLFEHKNNLLNSIELNCRWLSTVYLREKILQKLQNDNNFIDKLNNELDNQKFSIVKDDLVENIIYINLKLDTYDNEVNIITLTESWPIFHIAFIRNLAIKDLETIEYFTNNLYNDNNYDVMEEITPDFTMQTDFKWIGYRIPKDELPNPEIDNKQFFEYLIHMYDNNNKNRTIKTDLIFLNYLENDKIDYNSKILRSLRSNNKRENEGSVYWNFYDSDKQIYEKTGKIPWKVVKVTKDKDNNYRIIVTFNKIQEVWLIDQYIITVNDKTIAWEYNKYSLSYKELFDQAKYHIRDALSTGEARFYNTLVK